MAEKRDAFDDIFDEMTDEEVEAEKQVVKQPVSKNETVSDDLFSEETVEQPKTEIVTEQKDEDEDLDDFFSDDAQSTQTVETVMEAAPIDDIPKTQVQEIEVTMPQEFDYSDSVDSAKTVYTVYGLKGEGKTTFYMSFPGNIVILCFDKQADPIKTEMYDGDPRIRIKDGKRYYSKKTTSLMLATANITWNYLNGLLDDLEKEPTKPDWIVIDGSDEFLKIAEMVMRHRNGLQPFQGIANLNIWKERRMYLDHLHNRSLEICNKGVIYTAYVDYEEIIEDGTLVSKQDIPKWIDAMLSETRVVIRVFSKFNRAGEERFYARVTSSKRKYIKTGITVDITGIDGYNKILEASRGS